MEDPLDPGAAGELAGEARAVGVELAVDAAAEPAKGNEEAFTVLEMAVEFAVATLRTKFPETYVNIP